MVVAPVLVAVDPARTAKESAVPRATLIALPYALIAQSERSNKELDRISYLRLPGNIGRGAKTEALNGAVLDADFNGLPKFPDLEVRHRWTSNVSPINVQAGHGMQLDILLPLTLTAVG